MIIEAHEFLVGVNGYFYLGPILGVLVGAFIGSFFTRYHNDRNSYAAACAKFRAAFAPLLAIIYLARHHGSHNKPSVRADVQKALLSHGAAVEEFRPFVSKGKAKAFQEAWEDYRKNAALDEFEAAGTESAESSSGNELQAEELLEAKINKLLSFANFKNSIV
ncbi:hypothetical protein [Chitinimonas lacunae]|uniref:Uncharacterized protein n=1 Tax=Chitinimonas lacunae TaxID=1963018 RepID=A0ABV8MLV8_9NEIS